MLVDFIICVSVPLMENFIFLYSDVMFSASDYICHTGGFSCLHKFTDTYY